jgi:antitoxin component YwqK of YwqJK toxin-antitoxin module
MILLAAVGCGGEELESPPAGAGDAGPPAAGQLIPGREETDVTASAARRENSDSDGDGEAPLKRESVKIEPYKGEPIFLDEPPPPPPATVVLEKQTVTQNFPDGGVQIERQVTKYSDDRIVNDGTYKEFYPSGKLFVEGQYEDGDPVGEWTYWHENEKKNRTDVYESGELNGRWEVYRDDGSLEAEREFKVGQRHGEWIVYDDTGKVPLQKMHYQDGKPHGKWQEWYASGSPKGEYNFENGERTGEAIEWFEDGRERARASYRDGKLHGEVVKWDLEGKKFVQVYEDGRLIRQAN